MNDSTEEYLYPNKLLNKNVSSVDGINAYELSLQFDSGGYATHLYFIHNGNLYDFEVQSEDLTESKTTLNDIKESIKLIN